MRILIGTITLCSLALLLAGCGAPEAEFAWSESTQDLAPAAQKAAKQYVTDHFGTPAKMVGWQRLPINFGGISGVVSDVSYHENHSDIITTLRVDFRLPKVIADYDENEDGLLSRYELPAELQEEITQEKFDTAAGEDGFLSADELGKLRRIKSELYNTEIVSQITQDNAEELIGTEVLFVNGRYAGQSTKVRSLEVGDETVQLQIWPPLSTKVEDGAEAVDMASAQIMLDFGKTMKSGRHLYMRHCMHCHGVTGDGNGPTAEYLNPLPRDYRLGVFKFISTDSKTVRKPNRDDLTRILRNGIPGTYMPSFAILKDQEVYDIVEYVRWLSLRGEYEGSLNLLLGEKFSNKAIADAVDRQVANYERALKAAEESSSNPPKNEVTRASARQKIDEDLAKFIEKDLHEKADEEADFMLSKWYQASLEENVIYPTEPKPEKTTPESIARGRALFLGKCAVCHGVTGEGDGENTKQYQKKGDEEYPVPGFFDDWGHPIKPRNLTTGIYRGGRRPLDIYRRIRQGIPGGPMQSFPFTDAETWDLVNYVMSIPIDGPIPDLTAEAAETVAALKPNAPKVAQADKASGEGSE